MGQPRCLLPELVFWKAVHPVNEAHMPSHIPVSIEGAHVGDLIGGQHGVTFYSIHPSLTAFDGRSFTSVQEARTTLRTALWGSPSQLKREETGVSS
jgi:hypothetical protein